MAERKRKTEQDEVEGKPAAAKGEAPAEEAKAKADDADAKAKADDADAKAKADDADAKAKADDADAKAKADDAAEEPDADQADGTDQPVGEGDSEEAKEPARRRGSAETGTGRRRKAPPLRPDGEVVVRARAKYVRSAPRKARLVMDHIRGRPVEQALALLTHTPRGASVDVLKLLNSAVANAEANYELGADELRVQRAYVDEGPTIKRYRPRALGRATRINKRTSHMTIEVAAEPAKPAKRGKE